MHFPQLFASTCRASSRACALLHLLSGGPTITYFECTIFRVLDHSNIILSLFSVHVRSRLWITSSYIATKVTSEPPNRRIKEIAPCHIGCWHLVQAYDKEYTMMGSIAESSEQVLPPWFRWDGDSLTFENARLTPEFMAETFYIVELAEVRRLSIHQCLVDPRWFTTAVNSSWFPSLRVLKVDCQGILPYPVTETSPSDLDSRLCQAHLSLGHFLENILQNSPYDLTQ